jgi:hypothetical protein
VVDKMNTFKASREIKSVRERGTRVMMTADFSFVPIHRKRVIKKH